MTPGRIIDLMDDDVAGREDTQVPELVHRPADHAVTFRVARQFGAQVAGEGVRRAGEIDADGVVDHQFRGHDRIDAARVEAACHHCVAHGGEVDQQRHAGRIRHQDANGMKRQFPRQSRRIGPVRQRGDVVFRHRHAVLVPRQVLQQHFQ